MIGKAQSFLPLFRKRLDRFETKGENMMLGRTRSAITNSILALVLSAALACAGVALLPAILDICNATDAGKAYAATPKLSAKSKTMKVGSTFALKVKNAGKKKIVWRSSNKKVATVTSKGKVKAKKVGTTTISAKVGSRTLKCKVTVSNTLGKACITQVKYHSLAGNPYRRKATLYWRKVAGAQGYEVAAKWASSESVWINGEKTRGIYWDSSWSKLGTTRKTSFSYVTPDGVKYGMVGVKMRVRAYAVIDGRKVYGQWSNAKEAFL